MSDRIESFEIELNGQRRRAEAACDATLLTWLRDGLQATASPRAAPCSAASAPRAC